MHRNQRVVVILEGSAKINAEVEITNLGVHICQVFDHYRKAPLCALQSILDHLGQVY